MSHEKIKRVFESELNNYVDTKTPKPRVSYTNVRSVPKVGEVSFKSHIMPALTESYTLSGDHTLFVGVYQITIVAPFNTGTAYANQYAEELAGIFKTNRMFVGEGLEILQTKPLHIPEGFVQDTTYTLPVSFRYRCDTN